MPVAVFYWSNSKHEIVKEEEQSKTQRDQFQCLVTIGFLKECKYCLNDSIQENLE